MLKEKKSKVYVYLMSSRFSEDPGVLFRIGGLERADLLLSLQCEGQIHAFH